ncbi:hypothetical protein Pmani_035620 [Petrolisthes manimaculis]|uniref:Phosphoserine aminotransferase n=1 Tax=Petrolisthes manimaculis TaxID=1843537 RepID=A0AAE1TQC1_9EUCA|nr:hypothetical protein Pmani_035620 [Petrolisthes manimaculis]
MSQQFSYFSPGPAKIPDEVLSGLQEDLLQYKDTHISILELSHRSKEFTNILEDCEKVVRKLLKVPDNYRMLFMQGGATGQFAAVPLNLLSRTGKADYITTGTWSEKAAKEASKFGEVRQVKLDNTEPCKGEEFNPFNDTEASYVYYCSNETVHGVEMQAIPKVPDGVPIVCDMSSNFFTRPVDVAKFGMIYGGAQKNIGTPGTTLVIIREDLLGSPLPSCPAILDYTLLDKNKSVYNTPATFSTHVMKEVLEWVSRQGGVEEMERRCIQKSSLLYSIIDQSNSFYSTQVHPTKRSRVNVVFRVGTGGGNEAKEKKFVDEAMQQGLLSLKGHRSVGGIRASLYNAITLDDTRRLAHFMNTFLKENHSA